MSAATAGAADESDSAKSEIWLGQARPNRDASMYEFVGRARFDKLISGIVFTGGMVAVRGFEPRSRG